MLETIRDFADEQLECGGLGDEVRTGWASYFLDLAERAEPELWSVHQERWFDVLDAEHANLRAVLTWALDAGRNEIALRLTAALEPVWEARGHAEEGRQLLAAALARGNREASAARAKALFGLSRLLHGTDVRQEQAVLEEAAELARTAGATRELIFSLSHLGETLRELGDPDRGNALEDESVALAREYGDPWLTAMTLNNKGCTLLSQGDPEAARPLLEESLALRRALGEKRGVAVTLSSLGELSIAEGSPEAAASALTEALVLAREIGHRELEGLTLAELGLVAVMESRLGEAASALAESLEVCDEFGYAPTRLICLTGCAALAVRQGDVERAAELWGVVGALAESRGGGLPELREVIDGFLSETRSQLGEEAFARHAAAGARLSFDEAAALALNGGNARATSATEMRRNRQGLAPGESTNSPAQPNSAETERRSS
jgi:tetratricopeptide (TPR) repeat protein